MAKPRRPQWKNYVPPSPVPPFLVVEHVPGATYYECRLTDAIVGDEPYFRYVPPKKGCPFTVQDLAVAAAGELTEGRGLLTMQEYQEGLPVFTAVFVANGRQVCCVRSSDPARATPIDLHAARRAWLARRQARRGRG